jgi:hypothetical protein
MIDGAGAPNGIAHPEATHAQGSMTKTGPVTTAKSHRGATIWSLALLLVLVLGLGWALSLPSSEGDLHQHLHAHAERDVPDRPERVPELHAPVVPKGR